MRAMALGLLLLEATGVSGCGRVQDPGFDAGPTDLSGTATVITEAALFGGTIGARVGEIDIVSSLPDGSVLATGKTDASGSATIKVYPAGSVTAVYKHTADLGADLITWGGVKPGETLTFGSRSFSTAGQQSTNLGMQSYSWPPLTGATFYRVYTSCNTFGIRVAAPETVAFGPEHSTCHREPMDVIYAAFNAAGLMAFGGRSNVPFQNDRDVANFEWSQVKTGMISITGLPIEVSEVRGAFSPVFDGTTVIEGGIAGASYAGSPTGGAFTESLLWSPAGDRTVGSLSLARPGYADIQILDSFSSNTLTQTVAAPALSPWGRGSTTASAERGTASWSLVPDASSVHDGQVLQVSWSRTISTSVHQSQWHFLLPPGPTSITFPTLPAALAAHQPIAQDTMSATTRVFELSSVTSDEMLRTLPSASLMCLECAVQAGDIQRVVFTSL